MFNPMDFGNREALYKIVRARDKRYDGRFFCGVKTTGIYCRPICPARPLLKNMDFFRSAAEAEGLGFRPCLRCRPDLSPTSPQWDGSGAVVNRALRLIAGDHLDHSNFPAIAARLGISERHLRRLFRIHLGASPLAVLETHRLHFAKQLLVGSRIPITQVAFAAGFGSVRRFNDSFQKKFAMPPSRLRTTNRPIVKNSLEVRLPFIPPFDWAFFYSFSKRHAISGVEDFSAGGYNRAFLLRGSVGSLAISPDIKANYLNLRLHLSDSQLIREVIEKVRDQFDLRLNPHHLNKHKGLKGLRIPGSWDGFEVAVSIILGQLVSVDQARIETGRLVEKLGGQVDNGLLQTKSFLFPTPKCLARADLAGVGISRPKAQAIRALAREVLDNRIILSRTADLGETRKKLLLIPGIGPWTTEIIAMRCLGDTNAIPHNDLAIKKAKKRSPNVNLESFAPWSSYKTLSIWKGNQAREKIF